MNKAHTDRSSFRHTIKFQMKACNTGTTGAMINTAWLVRKGPVVLVYTLIHLLKDYYDVEGQDYLKKASKRKR